MEEENLELVNGHLVRKGEKVEGVVMKTKKVKEETVSVEIFDDEMGETYMTKRPKIVQSACELCSCAGCLHENCCEHLEYWNNEHGRPARFQLDALQEEIVRRDKVIAKLDKRFELLAAAFSLAIDGLEKTHIGNGPVKGFLVMAKSALSSNEFSQDRIFIRESYMCSACSCEKCNVRLSVERENRRNFDIAKVPPCCGHRVSILDNLPF